MPGYHWQPEEIEFVRELAGEVPMNVLTHQFNSWAEDRGRPIRSRGAIQRQIWKRCGNISSIPEGEWLTTHDIGRAVDRCQEAVLRWAKLGHIHRQHVRKEGYGWFISRRGLRQIARSRPQLFQHLNRERLYSLLEDLEVVEHVLTADCRKLRRFAPVRCIETGETYRSIRAAANSLGCRPNTVAMALKRRGTAKGFRFEEAC
jgi:hypothetical protein